MESIVYLVTWIIIVIALVIVNKTLGADSAKDVVMKTSLIIQYAEAFVSWAKQFKSNLSGNEKMDVVIEKLTNVADKHDIDISEDEIRAIAQKAYDTMKNKDEAIKSVSNANQTAIYAVNEILSRPDVNVDQPLSDFNDGVLRISE